MGCTYTLLEMESCGASYMFIHKSYIYLMGYHIALVCNKQRDLRTPIIKKNGKQEGDMVRLEDFDIFYNAVFFPHFFLIISSLY